MNITKHETYDYRNGNPARVICVDAPDTDYPVISIDPTGFPLSHTSAGEFLQGQTHPDDLVIRVGEVPECPPVVGQIMVSEVGPVEYYAKVSLLSDYWGDWRPVTTDEAGRPCMQHLFDKIERLVEHCAVLGIDIRNEGMSDTS